jgi:NADH-quinone oxidoreductase subunit M
MLSVLVWLPLAGGLLAAVAGRGEHGERRAGAISVLFALATLGLSIALIVDFDSGRSGLQHLEDFTWISELGIHYRLGVDGLNLFLIALSAPTSTT